MGTPLLDILGGPVGVFQAKIKPNLITIRDSQSERASYLVPHDAKAWAKNREYKEYLRELSKNHLIIYSDRGDYPSHPKIPNAVALRVALQPHEHMKNKIILPYNVETLDFIGTRKHTLTPNVSFMGLVPKNTAGRMLRTLITAPMSPIKGNGAATRKIYLNSLKGNSFNYSEVRRAKYGGLVDSNESHLIRRNEFIAMIANSDFVVAPRGDSNQSMRFFETLSSGRIPLFPDTKIAMPSMFEPIPERYFIRTRFNRKSIESFVSNYWGKLNNESYLFLQHEIRNYFQSYLEFNTFIDNLFRNNLTDFLNLAKSL